MSNRDLPITREEISFPHNDTILSGTISYPSGKDGVPGIVMLQGSGPADRDNGGYFPPQRDFFVKNGIAVLCYDKPGTRNSTGDWREQTFRDRALESIAALNALVSSEKVDAEKVGVWGFSQGGWIAPFAASISDLPSFVTIVSGPGVSPAVQNVSELRERARLDGFDEESIREAAEWGRKLMEAAREQLSYSTVEKDYLVSDEGKPWREYWNISDEKTWKYFTLYDETTDTPVIDHDPVKVLESVDQPLLAIFGENDVHVPVDESKRIFEDASTSTKSKWEILIFENADHGLYVDEEEFAPEYLEIMTDWILEQTSKK